MSTIIKNCLNCEELRVDAGSQDLTCYECYILSGQEEKDLRAGGADKQTLERFGYNETEGLI